MADRIKLGVVRIDLDLLYAVTQCQHADELRMIAAKFCSMHEFSRWIYGLIGPDIALTDYPAEWLASYKRNRWHHYGRDPLLNALGQRRRSMSWDLLRPKELGQPLGAVQKGILAERWEYGIRAGVTAPVYDRPGQLLDYAVVSFSCEKPLTKEARYHHEPHVQLFATYFQSVARTILARHDRGKSQSPVSLSLRETDCLSWAANGKSNWEIGLLMTISTATVKFHLSNAARKLGVYGRTLAVARAVRLGLINPV